MTLDKHAAERRRFARLLGVDGQLGSGLPIGANSSGDEQGPRRTRGRQTQRQEQQYERGATDRVGESASETDSQSATES